MNIERDMPTPLPAADPTSAVNSCAAMADLEAWLDDAGVDYDVVDACPEPVCIVCSTAAASEMLTAA